MQTDTSLSSPATHRRGIDPDHGYADQSIETITSEFNRQLQLKPNNDCENNEEIKDDNDNDDDEDEVEDDDFTFKFDDSPIDGDEVFEHGQIGPVFPLFDRKLLLDGDYDADEIDRLPIEPPVNKIFIPSPRRFPSSPASEHDATTGPYHAWSTSATTAATTAEMSKKSNSTGFSRLWRLKDKVGRSNSYGRDAFVFVKSSSSSKPAAADGGGSGKVNGGAVGKGRVGANKAKEGRVSAHEAYLKSRGGEEERRRRSYLPYRPELMGFFTNVHGGLTKNVHPY